MIEAIRRKLHVPDSVLIRLAVIFARLIESLVAGVAVTRFRPELVCAYSPSAPAPDAGLAQNLAKSSARSAMRTCFATRSRLSRLGFAQVGTRARLDVLP